MRRNRPLKVLKIALAATALMAGVTFLVMSLWNVLMPSIFGVRAISFWQALGLLVLSKFLFGRFSPFSSDGPRFRRHIMERLTPEERDRLKKGMRVTVFGRDRNPDAPNNESTAEA